jgi:hypothetical protein
MLCEMVIKFYPTSMGDDSTIQKPMTYVCSQYIFSLNLNFMLATL